MASTSRRRNTGSKRKEPERPRGFDSQRFLSKQHEDHFVTVQERRLLMERKASFLLDLVPEFGAEILRRDWEKLTTYLAPASIELVREFYTNAIPRGGVVTGRYRSFVRGRTTTPIP